MFITKEGRSCRGSAYSVPFEVLRRPGSVLKAEPTRVAWERNQVGVRFTMRECAACSDGAGTLGKGLVVGM